MQCDDDWSNGHGPPTNQPPGAPTSPWVEKFIARTASCRRQDSRKCAKLVQKHFGTSESSPPKITRENCASPTFVHVLCANFGAHTPFCAIFLSPPGGVPHTNSRQFAQTGAISYIKNLLLCQTECLKPSVLLAWGTRIGTDQQMRAHPNATWFPISHIFVVKGRPWRP